MRTVLSIDDYEIIQVKAQLNQIRIGDTMVYEKNGVYYRITLVSDLGGYIIECAESLEDARKNFFEDLDVISDATDKHEIIEQIIKYLNTADI